MGHRSTAAFLQGQTGQDPNLYAAKESLHEAGFAVDIKWSLLQENMKEKVVQAARNESISWGGEFSKRKEPWHFYKEVPGGRAKRTEYIEKAQSQFISSVINRVFSCIAPVL